MQSTTIKIMPAIERGYSRATGFTLIELMITISIVAILTTVAVPAMRDYMLNQRVKTASYDLMSTLLYARSEAIKRNCDINVTANVVADGWKSGWETKETDSCPSVDPVVLRDQPVLKDLSITSTSTTITYRKDGRLNAAAGNITIDVSPTRSGVNPRCIAIDLSGRPYSTKGACS